jgi:hypothetical protein
VHSQASAQGRASQWQAGVALKPANFPARKLRRQIRASGIQRRQLRQDEVDHGDEHIAMLIAARAVRTKIKRTTKG